MKFMMHFIVFVLVCLASGAEAAVATNRWVGAKSGGSWKDVSNWETSNGSGGWTKDASLLATRVTGATTRENACVWNFSSLNTGAIVTLDYSARFYALGFVLGSNKGNITLTGGLQGGCSFGNAVAASSENCYFTIPTGTVLIWKLENDTVDYDTGRGKLFQVQGGGKLSFESTMPFHMYDRALTVKDATVSINQVMFDYGACALNISSDSAEVIIGADLKFSNITGTSANSLLDIGPYKLTVTMSAGLTYAGRLKGSGIFDINSNGSIFLDGDLGDFSGRILLDGVWLDRKNAASGDGFDYQLEYGSRIITTNKALAARSIMSDGVDDEIVTGAGKTLSVGNDSQKTRTRYNARITGGGDFVKAGSDYELVLGGHNTYAGVTRVEGGALRTVDYSPFVSDGLLAFWTFEDYDRPFADITANALELTARPADSTLALSQLPALNDFGARSRRSLHFSTGEVPSTAQCKSAVALANLAGDTPFTHSFWIKPVAADYYQTLPESTSVDLLAMGTASDSANSCVFLSMNVSGTEISFATGRSAALVAGGFTLLDGAWHHVAVTYQNRRRRIYVDGVQRAADPSDIVSAMEMPQIDTVNFGYRAGIESLYVGEMDNIMLFNRCLGADEVAYLRNNNRPESRVEWELPKPVAHWDFNSAESPWKDVSGVSNITLEPDTLVSGSVVTRNAPGAIDGSFDGSVTCNGGGCLKLKIGATWPSVMPRGNGAFSIYCRVRITDSCSENATLWYLGVPQAGKYLALRACGYPRQFSYVWNQAAGSSYRDFTCGKYMKRSASVTSWSDIVTVYDPAAKTISHYVDGALESSHALTQLNIDSVSADFRFMIGMRPDRTDKSVWVYDDFQIFNCALKEREVKMLCRGMRPGTTAAVLPVDSPVTVAAGARLLIDENGPVSLKSIDAAGELYIGSLAMLTLSSGGSVSGTLSGSGELTLNGDFDLAGVVGDYSGIINASSRVDASRLADPTIKVGDSAVWRLDAPDDPASYPLCVTGGKIVMPPNGTVMFAANPKKRQKVTLFSGSELVAPDGIEGWVARPADDRYKVKFAIEDNKFTATINPYRGSAIIYK